MQIWRKEQEFLVYGQKRLHFGPARTGKEIEKRLDKEGADALIKNEYLTNQSQLGVTMARFVKPPG